MFIGYLPKVYTYSRFKGIRCFAYGLMLAMYIELSIDIAFYIYKSKGLNISS